MPALLDGDLDGVLALSGKTVHVDIAADNTRRYRDVDLVQADEPGSDRERRRAEMVQK